MAYFTASCDPPETNKRFAESLGVDYPILSDPTGATAQAYGIYKQDARMAMRWTFYIGNDGRIRFIDQEVKPGSHGEDVVERLKQLGVAARK